MGYKLVPYEFRKSSLALSKAPPVIRKQAIPIIKLNLFSEKTTKAIVEIKGANRDLWRLPGMASAAWVAWVLWVGALRLPGGWSKRLSRALGIGVET